MPKQSVSFKFESDVETTTNVYKAGVVYTDHLSESQIASIESIGGKLVTKKVPRKKAVKADE